MSHLKFIKQEFENRKTFIWEVFSTYDQSYLGKIHWHPPWRQYCFFPIEECVWSHDCLKEVSNFIILHKKDRSKPAEKSQSQIDVSLEVVH